MLKAIEFLIVFIEMELDSGLFLWHACFPPSLHWRGFLFFLDPLLRVVVIYRVPFVRSRYLSLLCTVHTGLTLPFPPQANDISESCAEERGCQAFHKLYKSPNGRLAFI